MKIALIGAKRATKWKAPYKDPDWTIWACAPSNMKALPRVDAWFENHVPAHCEVTRQADYMDYLKELPVVYMRDRSDHPNARAYPEEEMEKRFGPFFWTSSIAYMLAFAISQEPEEIGLWGIHMSSAEEYEYQRPGCQYYIQKAHDAGIKVSVPEGVTLLKPMKYKW